MRRVGCKPPERSRRAATAALPPLHLRNAPPVTHWKSEVRLVAGSDKFVVGQVEGCRQPSPTIQIQSGGCGGQIDGDGVDADRPTGRSEARKVKVIGDEGTTIRSASPGSESRAAPQRHPPRPAKETATDRCAGDGRGVEGCAGDANCRRRRLADVGALGSRVVVHHTKGTGGGDSDHRGPAA